MNRKKILESNQVQKKLERMALEIIERTAGVQRIVLIGIESAGYLIARIIGQHLTRFSGLDWPVYSVKIDKSNPLSKPIETDVPTEMVQGSVVILVDDVQNSGRTMSYAIRYFLQYPLNSLQTCVLVDRGHNSFPVKTDYVGLSLSTTLQEHIIVEVNEGRVEVFLT